MEAQITLADELRGAIKVPLRPLAKVVLLSGFAEEAFHETASAARARALKKRGYNARQWAKTPPEKRAARADYKAQWSRDNVERVRAAKRAWYHRNKARLQKIKRDQKRIEYARNPEAARARSRAYRARKKAQREVQWTATTSS